MACANDTQILAQDFLDKMKALDTKVRLEVGPFLTFVMKGNGKYTPAQERQLRDVLREANKVSAVMNSLEEIMNRKSFMEGPSSK